MEVQIKKIARAYIERDNCKIETIPLTEKTKITVVKCRWCGKIFYTEVPGFPREDSGERCSCSTQKNYLKPPEPTKTRGRRGR